MPDWPILLITAVVLVALVYLSILLARRWWLSAGGGLFDCALRPASGGRWRLGLARYSGDELEWYLVWHPLPRPSLVFRRGQVVLTGLRASDSEESLLAHATARILELRCTGEPQRDWLLALNEGSAMGLVSWLESAPPGQVGYRPRFDG